MTRSNARSFTKIQLVAALAIGLSLFAAGCGDSAPKGPDVRAALSDTKGLTPGAPVTWRGQTIGEVQEITRGPESMLVDIDLLPEHENRLPSGLAARAVKGELRLYGYLSPEKGALYTEEPLREARQLETISPDQWKLGAIGLGVLIVVILLLRGIKMMIKLVLAGALAAGGILYFRIAWDRHKADLVSPEMEARLDELMEETQLPEGMRQWMDTVKADALAAAEKARAQGGEFAKTLADSLDRKTREKLAELSEDHPAAKELKELQENIRRLTN